MGEQRFYEFGRYRLDTTGRVLFRGKHEVSLPPKAAETLLLLVQRAGSVVEKEELLSRVWPDTIVEPGSLTRTISLLRKTLGDSTGEQYIATVSKLGYRFVAAVTIRETPSAEDPGSAAAAVADGVQTKRFRIWIAGAALIAVVASGLFLRRQVLSRGAHPRSRLMIAVLPVQNLTGDPNREYIADGLTEEVINQLSRFNPERLGVIARTSSMAYRITGKTVQQIGKELSVDYVVENSLRADGDRLRITSQLVRVEDQTHVWSANYDRTLRDLFSFEDEISQAIAVKVGVELQAPGQELSTGRSSNPDAYLAYLEGRYYWNRRSPEALKQAISRFQSAIQLDPGYALAYAGLADAYSSQCLIADVPPREVFPLAKTAAQKALELSPGLAEAHTSLAYVKFWYDWDWAGAEAEFKNSLAINPGYATTHQWYAEFLRIMGRQQEAIAEGQVALRLDPLSLIINMEAGLPYYSQRRFDEAIVYFQKALDMEPNFGLAHCVLAWAYEGKGQFERAVKELEKARQLDDSAPVLASLAHAYAEAGQRRHAEEILSELKKRTQTHYVSPYFSAMAYIGLHEDQRALDALDQAYSRHDWELLWINVGVYLDPLRSQPRFVELLHRLNFQSGGKPEPGQPASLGVDELRKCQPLSSLSWGHFAWTSADGFCSATG